MTQNAGKGPKAGDRGLLIVLVPLLVFLIASAGPVRDWAREAATGYGLVFDVMPSFFAGAILALFVAIMERHSIERTVLIAGGVAVILESVQIVLPSMTFDQWDVIAGLAGVGVAAPFIARQNRQ